MAEERKLRRSLKSRHMMMIALGGSIGTGLFVAGGETISTAGPGGALVAYGLIGLMVYFLMTSLGEMATYLPTSGSFGTYATRYVDPAFGFALGWNYWFNWAITLAAEILAGALIMKYWFPDVPASLWSALFIGALFLINILSTRSFGESEYVFSSIKVITVFVFLFIGSLLILGIGGTSPGFENWTTGEAPFVGGLGSILAIFMVAGFSFQGTELIGVAAGESEDPEKNVPKAIKSIFWRILMFYIGAFIVIGFLIPYTDPNLLNSSIENVSISPFTLVFERAGLAAAASVMNAVILTSVISSANSWLYAASRMLFGMAKEGHAPKVFAKTNTSNGVPIYAILATVAIGLLAFLTSIFGTEIYFYLVAASGLSGFLAWIGIAICHFRFRRAFIKQGHKLSELGYHAKWFPIGPIIALILSIIIVIGQITTVTMNAQSIITTYLALPLFLILYFSYKIVKKTKLIPLEEVDLSREID